MPQCPAHHSPHQGSPRTKPGCVCMHLRASVYMCLYAYATMSSTPQSSSGIASNKAWLCVYAFACKCVYVIVCLCHNVQHTTVLIRDRLEQSLVVCVCICVQVCICVCMLMPQCPAHHSPHQGSPRTKPGCVCMHLRASVCMCLYAYATMSSTPQSSSGIASNKAWLCVYACACKCVYVFVCLCHNVQHTTVLIRDRLKQSLVVCICIACKCVYVFVCLCRHMCVRTFFWVVQRLWGAPHKFVQSKISGIYSSSISRHI